MVGFDGRAAVSLGVLALGLASACGGETGAGTACGPFTACGGEPAGVWTSTSYCPEAGWQQFIDAQDMPDACQGSMTILDVESDVTLTLRSDQTFEGAGSVTLPWAIRFDPDCVSALAGGAVTEAGMSAFCAGVEMGALSGESAFASMACRVVQSICWCDGTQVVAVEGSGGYSVEGTSLSFTTGGVAEFCVDGDSLQMRQVDDVYGGLVTTYQRVAP